MIRRGSHRCDRCANRVNRCAACREARAEVRRALLKRKRAEGICLECTKRALPGHVRCQQHRKINNALSRVGHERARRAAGIEPRQT